MSDNLSISTAGGTKSVETKETSTDVHLQRALATFLSAAAARIDATLPSTTLLGPLPTVAYQATDFVMLAGLGLTPKFAVINLTATGTLVAAVASKKIRVLALLMTVDFTTGDETYTFKSGAAGTALTGAFGSPASPANRPVIPMPFNPLGWFETTSGVLLELSLAGTTPIAQGCLVYVEV